MVRPKTWRAGPGFQGPGATQPGWSVGYASGTMPNGHTIVRIVLYGSVSLNGTANSGAVANLVPPTNWVAQLSMGSHIFHVWGISSRVSIAEMYDNSLVTPARVPYWYVQSDAWDVEMQPNYKIPASGTNTVRLDASAQGPNTFVNGTYTMTLISRVLTMAP